MRDINTGKYLEQALQEAFSKVKHSLFQWRRLYDSFSAQGKALPAQPSDFFVCCAGSPYHIEAKTSKDSRLKMFPQYGPLLRWDSVGVTGLVVVHFYTPDRLFVVPVRELVQQPSWVLDDEWEIKNIQELITMILERRI